MLVIVGLVVVFGSIILVYTMHHGQLAVLVQVNEFLIIGGAGLGAMIVANPMSVVIGPMANAIEAKIASEHAYMMCIRTALLSFSRGDSPMTSVEFARRNIEPVDR
ncbi:MAG: motility-associated protein, partial [Gemmatimonadaceae bacterium]